MNFGHICHCCHVCRRAILTSCTDYDCSIRHRIALVRSIGRHLDNIVVDNADTAKTCIKYLRDQVIIFLSKLSLCLMIRFAILHFFYVAGIGCGTFSSHG